MCRTSSVGRREKGLNGGEGEGEGEEDEESGGSEEGEVILLNLRKVGGTFQHLTTLSYYTHQQSTMSGRSCSRSEMKEWERTKNSEDLLDGTLYTQVRYLEVSSVCLVKLSDAVRCRCQRVETLKFVSFLSTFHFLIFKITRTQPGDTSRAAVYPVRLARK